MDMSRRKSNRAEPTIYHPRGAVITNKAASPRMYKSRLARWGLKKNITTEDVPELVHQMQTEATRNSTALAVRGRQVSMIQVGRYMKRNTSMLLAYQNTKPHSEQDTTSPRTGKRLLAPAPSLLASPIDMRFPEEIIYLSRQFVAGCYEGGTWRPDRTEPLFFASEKTNGWLNETTCGALLIKEGHYARAFKSLDISFDQLKALLHKPEPSLFIYLYFATLQLPENISQRMRAYVAEMSAITLPANHPMRLVWSRICQVENRQLLNHAWTILYPYYHIVEERFRYCEYGALKFSAVFYRIMAQLNCVDLEAAKSKLIGIAQSLELLGSHADQVLHTKLAVVKIHLGAKEYDEAATVLREVAKSGGSHNVRSVYHCLNFDLHKATGTTKHAVDTGRHLMWYCLNEYGPAHGKTLDAISAVQAFSVEIGRVKEGDRLRQILESEEGLERYFEDIGMADEEDGKDEVPEQ
jgi:hypothetical protein